MGCATGLVKFVVFGFNAFFFLVGIGFIVIGVLFKLEVDTDILGEDQIKVFEYAPIFTITVGCIVTVISFFGCCGTLRDSTCLLTTYASILLFILLLQIGIGVYAFVQVKNNGEDLNSIVRSGMKKSITNYGTNDVVKEFYDESQKTLKCCGVERADDWYGINGFSALNLPVSCCENKSPCTTLNAYKEGCARKVAENLKDNIEIIGIVVLSIAGIELIAATVVLCLVSSIKNESRRGRYN